jgi:hypothetical protein
LVCSNHTDELIRAHLLEKLSLNCEVITCFVEEHVMVSSASAWQNGKELWSILHDAQNGIEHLETTGELPATFAAIRENLESEQAAAARQAATGKKGVGVDYIFDIPVSMAQALTNFRYDMIYPDRGDAPFRNSLPQKNPNRGSKLFSIPSSRAKQNLNQPTDLNPRPSPNLII